MSFSLTFSSHWCIIIWSSSLSLKISIACIGTCHWRLSLSCCKATNLISGLSTSFLKAQYFTSSMSWFAFNKFLFPLMYNCPSCWWCWGDDKRDGNHLVGFLFGDIILWLWCSCGTSWSTCGGTCWTTRPFECGSGLSSFWVWNPCNWCKSLCNLLRLLWSWYGMGCQDF